MIDAPTTINEAAQVATARLRPLHATLLGAAAGGALTCILFPATLAGTIYAAPITKSVLAVVVAAALTASLVTTMAASPRRWHVALYLLLFLVSGGAASIDKSLRFSTDLGEKLPRIWLFLAPIATLSAACFVATLRGTARHSSRARWAGTAAGVATAYALMDRASSMWVALAVVATVLIVAVGTWIRGRRGSTGRAELLTLYAALGMLGVALVVHSWASPAPLFFCVSLFLTAFAAAAVAARYELPLRDSDTPISPASDVTGPTGVDVAAVAEDAPTEPRARAQSWRGWHVSRVARPAEALALAWAVLLVLTFSWTRPEFLAPPTTEALPWDTAYPEPAPPDPMMAFGGVEIEEVAANYARQWDEYNRASFQAELELRAARNVGALSRQHNSEAFWTVWLRRAIKFLAWVILFLCTRTTVRRARSDAKTPAAPVTGVSVTADAMSS